MVKTAVWASALSTTAASALVDGTSTSAPEASDPATSMTVSATESEGAALSPPEISTLALLSTSDKETSACSVSPAVAAASMLAESSPEVESGKATVFDQFADFSSLQPENTVNMKTAAVGPTAILVNRMMPQPRGDLPNWHDSAAGSAGSWPNSRQSCFAGDSTSTVGAHRPCFHLPTGGVVAKVRTGLRLGASHLVDHRSEPIDAMAREAKIVKFRLLGPASVALFVICSAFVAAPALAQVCACKKTASGICQRWLKAEIPWSLYLGSGKGIITDDALEKASVQAFAAWANVSCKLCMRPDAATESCKAVECDANPLGIVPKYMGRAAEPMLASSCNGVYCPAAAPGTSQIAVIRDAAQWPMSTGVITAPILTVTKQGEIIDADVLFFDNGKSWCLDKCLPNQYPLAGALLQEVGHFLGVGFSQQTLSVLAANFSDNGTNLLPTLGIDDAQCVCQIYRAASDIAQCEVKVERTSGSCSARPSQTNSSQGPRGAPEQALTILAVALAALVWRRQHSGTVLK